MSNIDVKIVADSVSAINGKRITTYELQYPRFIHGEFMTHRMISRNAASSRAIPVKAMLDNIRENPAMPSHWGKNQPGMQAKEECHNDVELSEYLAGEWQNTETREGAWDVAAKQACMVAEAFAEAGYHKQIVNRLTEPFQMIKVVATATEWDNLFWLRYHEDAQPEMRILAKKIWEAREASIPDTLKPGEWHTPYVDHWGGDDGSVMYGLKVEKRESNYPIQWLTLEEALKVSASMCAQVSYRRADDTLEKALMVYDRLVESKPVHASPFEHQATPMGCEGHDWEQEGVTCHHKVLGLMSGNFAGWIQHRQLIAENTCWNFKE